MLQKKRFTIDEAEYEITQLGAVEGRRLWLRLLKTISGVVKDLANAAKLDERAMAGALATLVAELDEPTYEALCEAFARRCTIRNGDKWPDMTPTAFDLHFAGNYIAMSQWLGECVMFNFANFSGDASLGKLIDLARSKVAVAMASKSQSQQTSTGTSGAS